MNHSQIQWVGVAVIFVTGLVLLILRIKENEEKDPFSIIFDALFERGFWIMVFSLTIALNLLIK